MLCGAASIALATSATARIESFMPFHAQAKCVSQSFDLCRQPTVSFRHVPSNQASIFIFEDKNDERYQVQWALANHIHGCYHVSFL
jgi:hypothetical protein